MMRIDERVNVIANTMNPFIGEFPLFRVFSFIDFRYAYDASVR